MTCSLVHNLGFLQYLLKKKSLADKLSSLTLDRYSVDRAQIGHQKQVNDTFQIRVKATP